MATLNSLTQKIQENFDLHMLPFMGHWSISENFEEEYLKNSTFEIEYERSCKQWY